MNMMKALQQAKQMQQKMQTAQQELAQTTVTGTAGGQAVTVTLRCTYELEAVKISPEALGDAELLEDLVFTATKDALAQVKSVTEQKMSAITGGLNLPGF